MHNPNINTFMPAWRHLKLRHIAIFVYNLTLQISVFIVCILTSSVSAKYFLFFFFYTHIINVSVAILTFTIKAQWFFSRYISSLQIVCILTVDISVFLLFGLSFNTWNIHKCQVIPVPTLENELFGNFISTLDLVVF